MYVSSYAWLKKKKKTTVQIRTGSLSAPDVNSTDDNQPWKKPTVGSQPGSILTFQDLCLTMYTT